MSNQDDRFKVSWAVSALHTAVMTRAEIVERFGVAPEELGRTPCVDEALDCGDEVMRAMDDSFSVMEGPSTLSYREGAKITGVDLMTTEP